MRRLPIAIPILASLASFILVLLALIAGSSPGYMEDYDIVTFNTSALGKNLLSNALDDDDEPTPTTQGEDDSICDDIPLLGKVCSSATSAAASLQSEIIDKIDDINNDIADRLADRLGIHEFYSLHVLTICDGEFEPNATSPNAGRNVSSCKKGLDGGYNVSSLLDHDLSIGPLQISLLDLGFTDELQQPIDTLNKATKALAILFIVTTALVGLSFLTSVLAIFLIPGRREASARILNLVVSVLAVILLLVSCILVTVAGSMAVDEINELGEDIGLSASQGKKYLIISWISAGLFIVGVFGFWAVQTWRWRKGGAKRNFPRAGEGYHHEKSGGIRDSEETAGTGHTGRGRRVRWKGRGGV